MARSEPRSTSHPFRVYFTGEAGDEVAALLTKNKGFISHHAFIATSGMNGGVPFTHPINVTAYGSTSESLVPKNVYSMNCKLIGSNNDRDDHLHFENNNRINLGPAENFPEIFIEELLDKISIVAMGIVVAREIIRDPAYQSKPTVVVTLKSTDYDPITRAPVSWLSKHYVPPVRNLEKAQNLCQLGRELQLVGVWKDYNTTGYMWESEVHSITVTSGHLTAAAVAPSKSPGRPNGGRAPLALRSRTSKVPTTLAVELDSSDSITDENSSSLKDIDLAIQKRLGQLETVVEAEEPDKDATTPTASKRPRRG